MNNGCLRKIRHATKQAAEMAAAEIRRQGRGNVRAYRCKYCLDYHTGKRE